MNLTDISTIKKILKENNLWANKKFGQNFLTNKKVLDKIITAAEIQNNDHVVEVGPGLGCLTIELAKLAEKVTTIELDTNLIPILQKNLTGSKNVEILNEDALEFELPTGPYKVVANIPYNITSPLINHFVKDTFMSETLLPPTSLTLLIQKEVAEKICSEDGKLNVFALNVQTFADCEIIAGVPKDNFYPEPQVDSAVIKIKVLSQPKVSCNLKKYFQIISAAFAQKRKKINNSLTPLFQAWDLDPEKIFQKAGIDPNLRPEDLKIRDFDIMTNSF